MKKTNTSGKKEGCVKKLALVLSVLMLLNGCSYICSNKGYTEKYSQAETSLSDFSKKVIGHYSELNIDIPETFDGAEFIRVLEQIYPDKSHVESIKNNYKVLARRLDANNYSVVLCDPKTGNKIMEDLSLSMSRVECDYWKKGLVLPCEFEKDWHKNCE